MVHGIYVEHRGGIAEVLVTSSELGRTFIMEVPAIRIKSHCKACHVAQAGKAAHCGRDVIRHASAGYGAGVAHVSDVGISPEIFSHTPVSPTFRKGMFWRN